ncbi:MAG: ANTAR domain-containing response regulator [Arenicella sp.]
MSIDRRFHKKLKCLVIHPNDHDCSVLMGQLDRVGCICIHSWPEPPQIPSDIDVVLFYLDQDNPINYSVFDDDRSYALIAMLDYEHPKVLEALINANVQGIITKPIRPFGIFAHLLNAKSIHQYELRLKARIEKLDTNLKSSRKVEKASKIIASKYQVSKDKAYALIRKEAMNKQITIDVMADSIIHANEFLMGGETE